MRNFKLTLLTSLLVVALLSVGSVNAAEKSTDVSFGLAQEGCFVQLEVHDDLYLGTISENFSEGDTITSENAGNGNKKIKVKTDCANVDLGVEATNFRLPPKHTETADTAIQRFGVKTDSDNSYTTFSELNSAIDLKDITGANAPAGQETENVVVDYQYTVGSNDVSGAYTAVLLYTAATD